MPLARLIRASFRACCALAFLSFGVSLAADTTDLRKSADNLVQSLGLQRDLPTKAQKADPQTIHDPGSSIWFGDAQLDSLPGNASAFWNTVQWALIGLGAIVLLAFLCDWLAHDWLLRISAGASAQTSIPTARAGAAIDLEQILAQAEQHAAAGEYREALHGILFAALALLRTHTSIVRESLTSREILAAAKLEPAATGALRRLLVQVEAVWFGQKPVSAADYTAALTYLQAFREAQWPAR
jgi:hypothetical protein